MDVCNKLYNEIFNTYCTGNPRYYEKHYENCISKEIDVDIIDDYEFVSDIYDNLCELSHAKNYDIDTIVYMPSAGQRVVIKMSANMNSRTYLCIKADVPTSKVRIQTKEGSVRLNSFHLQKTVIIHDDLSIYTSREFGKNYPSSVYDISFMPLEIQKIIFSFLSPHSLIWKDFVSDAFYPSVPIGELSQFHNKKEYLEKVFGFALPKSTNKRNLHQQYAACCAIKYIKPEQTDYFLSLDISSYFANGHPTRPVMRNRKEIAKRYIVCCFNERVNGINKNILSDYVEMAILLKEPIDIKAGKRRIYQYHDYLADRLLIKANRGKKLKIPETPLKYLALSKPFILLKTKFALISEGKRNHNCVGSYVDKVNKGGCVIYTADINGEHLTIEICCRKNRRTKQYSFYVNQCYKSYNQSCKPETLEFVKNQIQNCADKAIEKFEKRKHA